MTTENQENDEILYHSDRLGVVIFLLEKFFNKKNQNQEISKQNDSTIQKDYQSNLKEINEVLESIIYCNINYMNCEFKDLLSKLFAAIELGHDEIKDTYTAIAHLKSIEEQFFEDINTILKRIKTLSRQGFTH